MLNNFVYNSKLFFEDTDLNIFIKNNFGLKNNFFVTLKKRFEKYFFNQITDLENFEKEIFFLIIYNIVPYNSDIFKKKIF